MFHRQKQTVLLPLLLGLCFFGCHALAEPRLLTAEQKRQLQGNRFLTFDCTGASCKRRDYIDFRRDCGISISAELEARWLIDDLDNLRIRVRDYPKVAVALNQNTPQFQDRMTELQSIYTRLGSIVNSNGRLKDKIKQTSPLLIRADAISGEMANMLGVEFEGGCGAGPEDSQSFSFVIEPKAVYAGYILNMDYAKCRLHTDSPDDPDKCSLWIDMQPSGNELSGNYRYRVVWPNGAAKTGTIPANGTTPKTFTIKQ
jgi:hypothetical protein